MTTKPRIFVDQQSKTVIHAIEEEYNTFQRNIADLPSLKRISHISRSQLKSGSRQQSSGNEVFEELMKEGNFEEVTPETLIVKQKLSEQQITDMAQNLAAQLGISSADKFNVLLDALSLIDKGTFTNENINALPEYTELQPEDESHTANITKVVNEFIQEFDEQGYIDWRTRDSFVARLRTLVRKKLKRESFIFLQSTVNRIIDNLLASQPTA